ncbi:tetratricopeptide (TPR) repeat protein [Streptosporangium becharense]|uniref:Tetratricopeptide (TPR) repeat protein n=1 Tax=Streptosporangium becharense TaxID=1816182 RepID=A0A7W9MIG9_9ACTN|nr:CHAT domain-containing protein [Streptosporangium becharense]MBB2913224.1 tetratricopeptide (TPR) repeat protein [Streptosporangium becharense]MBB5822207.1 tetratricopeptide (TPR) repeat protein [Streptosporangium becharense]
MTPDEILSAAEHAVELSGSDPAGARSLARTVLDRLPPSCAGTAMFSTATTADTTVLPTGTMVLSTGTAVDTTRRTATDAAAATAGAAGDVAGAGHGADRPGCRWCEAAAVGHRALAVAARELGDLPMAAEHLGLAVGVALAAGLPHRAAQARLSLVHVRTELGHPEQALAVAAVAEPDLPPAEVGRLDVHRAVALSRLGRYREAVECCDRAAGVLGDDVRFLAGAMLNRGLARVFLAEFEAAEADLGRCAGLARGAGLDHVLALAEGNLPFLAARRGDLPAAFTAYRRAEESLFGYPERLATVRCDLAEALVAARLPGEARALLDLAVPELAAAGAEVALAEARLLLAQVELATGDPRRARESAELAAAGLAAQGRTVFAPLAAEILLRARLALDPPDEALLAEMLACAADLDAAGHRNASAALRLTGAEVALRLGDRAFADGQLTRLARFAPGVVGRQATALRRALAGDRRGAFAAVLAGLAEVGAGTRTLTDPVIRAHAVRAGESLAALGLALAVESRRGRAVLAWAERWRAVAGGAVRPVAPDLAALRAALGESALVEFIRHAGELVAVAVTPSRVALRRLGPAGPVAEATVRLRYGLRRTHLLDGSAARPAAGAGVEAAELERLLFGSLRGPLGDRPLVIVPTGALHTLPWPLLPMNSDRPVTVAASAASWLAAHPAPPSPPPERGARGRLTPSPESAPSPPPGGRTRDARVAVVAGPGLRCAGAEADMVGACHPAAVRVAARRAEVLAALERSDVAHLAAHGMFSPRSPLLSSIDLDDGPLMAYDLLRLRTPPGLVVLSACDAGMAHAPADGAPLGLAGTFLSLGTLCVIASLVPVRDEETLTLMTAFHEALSAGDPPARALATASGKTGVAGFACFGYGDQPVATGRDGSLTQSDHEPT